MLKYLLLSVVTLVFPLSGIAQSIQNLDIWQNASLTWGQFRQVVNEESCSSGVTQTRACVEAVESYLKTQDPTFFVVNDELENAYREERMVLSLRVLRKFGPLRVVKMKFREDDVDHKKDYHEHKKISALQDVSWMKIAINDKQKIPFKDLLTWMSDYYVSVDVRASYTLGQAINGFLIFTEDPHAKIEPRALRQVVRQNLPAKEPFIGLGIVTRYHELGAQIAAVVLGSPAYHAGLKVKEVITEIDGQKMINNDYNSFNNLLSGPKGSTVKLVMYNTLVETYHSKELQRGPIIFSNVFYDYDENEQVGYIKIHSFNPENTSEEVAKALDYLKLKKALSIIVDIRNNGGGYVHTALETSGLFLGPDVPVYTAHQRERNKWVTYRTPENSVLKTTLPVVALVNQNTASSAEIFASGLQYNTRALVVGVHTYGKATGQDFAAWSINNKFNIFKTTEMIYQLNGVSYQGIGLLPDIEVFSQKQPRDFELYALREGDRFTTAIKPYINDQREAFIRYRNPALSHIRGCANDRDRSMLNMIGHFKHADDYQYEKALDALKCQRDLESNESRRSRAN